MFIQTLLNNETLELSTNGLENRYFLFVEDAVEYIIKVLEKDSQQPYLVNIVGNVPTSIYRTAETISSLIPGGKKINIRNQFISGVSHSFNTTKMNNDFQISQTNLIDGLRKEISGFQR